VFADGTMDDMTQSRWPDEHGGEGARSVYEQLRAQIVDGVLNPGTALAEGPLAKRFGVSRTPIREALSQLTYEGLLERSDRAMRVRVLKAEEVLEIYEVRIALERAAARAGAERRTELDLAGLSHILNDMRDLDEAATARRPKLAHAFHFAIWRSSHNATLVETLENVHLRVLGLSSTTLHYPQRWKVFTDECTELLDAIRGRDISRAGDVAERQMINARDFRVKLYSSEPGRLPDRLPPGR
jgi:DNA-binding GntR family transcriptional regulator